MSLHWNFQFVLVLLGFKTPLATIQRVIEIILSSIRWQSVLWYLDITVIFLRNVNMHMAHLPQVLTMLQDEEVLLKLKKCSLLAEMINHLVHIIRLVRLDLSEARATAVRKLKGPTKQSEVRPFLILYKLVLTFYYKLCKNGSPTEQGVTKISFHIVFFPYSGRKGYSRKPEVTINRSANTSTPISERLI